MKLFVAFFTVFFICVTMCANAQNVDTSGLRYLAEQYYAICGRETHEAFPSKSMEDVGKACQCQVYNRTGNPVTKALEAEAYARHGVVNLLLSDLMTSVEKNTIMGTPRALKFKSAEADEYLYKLMHEDTKCKEAIGWFKRKKK